MIFHFIILMTTSLFFQVNCRTYVPEKDFVDHNLNRRQTYNLTHDPTYKPTEQRPIVLVDKGQFPNGWNENIMKGDHSPIIFTDNAPITINYKGSHSGPERPPNGFRNSRPTVVTSQGNVTVNYDDSQEDVVQQSNQDICLLTNIMVELPSGIVMPYLKFKAIPYLPAESQKSDIRVILNNRNMTYKRFQETLRYYGCRDLEQDLPRPSEVGLADYVTLTNGTLKVKMDEYQNIVRSIISGSETLMVPNVVSGKYALYCSLIADELPELIASTFVIAHEGIVVPFSLYYAVDREHFQRPRMAAVIPKIRQIKWRDGKLVDVQTVRHVIDALRTPTLISFVFPNGKRMPFMRCNVEDPTGLYDYDPEKVLVDVGQCNNVLLSHFNDILSAVHIPDDDGKHKPFNSPAVFALDPKCLQNTVICAQPLDGKVCRCANVFDDRKYSGYSIHVIHKDQPPVEDKPADKKLTVFGPVSAMENTTGLDSNDTIRIILTSSSGTNEIKITNVLNNKKPLIYDITDKPIDVRDLTSNMPLNECDCSPVYLMNKANVSNVAKTVNPQSSYNCTNILKARTECNCIPILKNNQTNVMVHIKNTPNDDPKNPLCLNESTKNQTTTVCNKNPTTNNNQNHTTTNTIITTTTVTQNNIELMNTSSNHSTYCGKIYNITTIETENNSTENPGCIEKCTKIQQNSSNPITECNKTPIVVKSNNDQIEIKNTTVGSPPNLTSKYTTDSNNTIAATNDPNQIIMTSNRQNSLNPVTEYKEVPKKNDNNQSQTENKNITTNPNSAINASNSNISNMDKNYEPNNTSDNTVNMEIINNTITDPNYTAIDSGSNEIPNFNNTVDTIQTSDATRSFDAADDIGHIEDPKLVPESDTGINNDTSADAYITTTDGKTKTNKPSPIYTETIKNPNNSSVSNNVTKIINIIVY